MNIIHLLYIKSRKWTKRYQSHSKGRTAVFLFEWIVRGCGNIESISSFFKRGGLFRTRYLHVNEVSLKIWNVMRDRLGTVWKTDISIVSYSYLETIKVDNFWMSFFKGLHNIRCRAGSDVCWPSWVCWYIF